MSHITAHCDPLIAEQLFKILPNIRELNLGKECSSKHWKQILLDNFTHLHPTEDNLFSPNRASPKPVNGIFVSLDSLSKLLSNDKNIKITDEFIKFIVDLLNFFKNIL